MTNEDIILAFEKFVSWSNEDKKKIVSSLSGTAIDNAIWWLGQTRSGIRKIENMSPKKETTYNSDYDYSSRCLCK